MTKRKRLRLEPENKVKRMLDTWDIVECHSCGKNISIVNDAVLTRGEKWSCRGCNK